MQTHLLSYTEKEGFSIYHPTGDDKRASYWNFT